MEDNSERPEAAPSFDINQEYQDNYLKSNYESDEYHELKTMEEELDKIVTSEILALEAFASLRRMTIDDLPEGQDVKVNNEKKAKIVKRVGKTNVFVARLNDGTEIEVNITNIEPTVDPIMKLKKPQLKELYEKCYEALVKKNGGRLDIVNFFYVFTEYFRVNERYLFACLEPKDHGLLMDEIKKRTDMVFNKGINPMFRSGQ